MFKLYVENNCFTGKKNLQTMFIFVACFVYVSIEVYNSFDFYYQYLTTTEINKINKPEIPFPAVTICNFNR